MPLVQISIPAGSLSPDQKREMVPDGVWGIGGHALTLAGLEAKLRPSTDGAR